ncbi:hypothetical protein SK128_012689, partial [Halocaridina rubra]
MPLLTSDRGGARTLDLTPQSRRRYRLSLFSHFYLRYFLGLWWDLDLIHNSLFFIVKVALNGELPSSATRGTCPVGVFSPSHRCFIRLFHRAILQSGTAICPWSIAEGHRDIAMKIGHKLSCNGLDSLTDTDKSMHLLTCLQNASINDLVRVPEDFIVFLHLPIVMAPRIDGIFLPDHPARLLKEGNYNKINMISGITRDETGAIVR